MNRPEPEDAGCSPREGGAGPGREMRPLDLPDAAPSESPPTPREVPVGRPVGPAEYERLKERANREVLPPSEDAQQDPTTRRDPDP